MEKKTHAIVASVILSILVWLSVSMNYQYSVSVRVPFRVSDIPSRLSLASPVPKYIQVRIRGTGWQLASSYLSTTASINFDASIMTRKPILLTSRDLGYSLDIGSSAEVLGFQPDTVTIQLDSTVTRLVPILARVSVSPREGFMVVGDPQVTPDSVFITGARRLIDRIGAWHTQYRSFERRINSVSTKIPLSDTLGGIVSVSVAEANVIVDVEQVTDNIYKNVQVVIDNNRDSTRIILLPPTVDITVRGGINEMANITSDSFRVSGDYLRLIRQKSKYFQPTVRMPSNLTLLTVDPDSVEFIIRK